MDVVGIIPARLQSTRLPNKLLLRETGRSLLEHTWRAANQSQRIERFLIATDSEEIAEEARQFGAEVCMTGECENGTVRVARALENSGTDAELVVNIQGDEPEIEPSHIDKVVAALDQNSNCEMATLANPILSPEQVEDPSCVKVVCSTDGRALYFSRSTIPYSRDRQVVDWFEDEPTPHNTLPWLQHIGLYAYRVPFLRAFVQMPASPLEQIEQLEQLRALQAGAAIHVSVVPSASRGIDTPADYAAFVERMKAQA